MDNCIFCMIIKGVIPSKKIYEDKYTYAFLDIACDSVGHTLVIPKKHCDSILDTDKVTLARVMDTVAKISNHYVNDCGYDGVNVLNASGSAAQQSVFHLHFHIIPRNVYDGKDMFPLKEKLDINLDEVCDKLKMY
ncbi:MAG: HIT family protein [Clostridia bacterium]